MSSHPTPTHPARAAPLQLLHAEQHAQLLRALDDAVAADPLLLPARGALLTPLRLLDGMAREAAAALGDDVVAAERLRLLISLAEPHTASAALLDGMLAGSNGNTSNGGAQAGAGGDVNAGHDDGDAEASAPPCGPALLHTGALALIGLSAGRVGRPLGLARPMIDNVLGLALAAGPAEVIARALASGMSNEQLQAILAGLLPQDGRRGFAALIATFLTDLCEQARWACLRAVFARVTADAMQVPWDAAGSGSIVHVTPADGCSGDVITLLLNTRDAHKDALDGSHFLALLAAGAASVVFAAEGRHSIARRPHAVDVEARTVQVRVPPGARAGWLGFVDEAALEQCNAARSRLRERWDSFNRSACLHDAPLPTSSIADLPDPPTPPRTSGARFGGGQPVVVEASLEPDVVDIGGTLVLRWRTAGATEVGVEPPVDAVGTSGSVTLTAGPDHARIEHTITASNRCGQQEQATARARVRARISDFSITQHGQAPLIAQQPLDLRASIQPPDNPFPVMVAAGSWVRFVTPADGGVHVVIPEHVVVDGFAGTIRVLATANGIDDERTFGPLRLVPLQQRTIVVIRPALIGRRFSRVTTDELSDLLHGAARSSAQQATVVEPAWLDDEDISCQAQPDGPDVPETLRLLERLNLLAARNPGREAALWLAVVPAPAAAEGFHRIEAAEGACAVAVATPDHVRQLLAEPLPPLAARTRRLRVIGTIGTDHTIRLEELRVEQRHAGAGTPVTTDLSLFGLAGRAIRFAHPVRLMSRSRPARLVALMPVTPEMDELVVARTDFEGSDDTLVLRRVQRPDGRPEVVTRGLSDSALAWDYMHTRNAHARFTIEVGHGDGWSPLAHADPCTASIDLLLERIAAGAPAERVRVVATDGWNTDATRPERLPPRAATHQAFIRSAGQGVLWADLNFDVDVPSAIAWRFGRTRRTGFTVTLPPSFAGDIVLTVQGPEGQLTDRRRIDRAGVAETRALRWAREATHA